MSNKEVLSLEGVVKSDSNVEQRVYSTPKPRFRGGCSRLHRPRGRLYSVLCSRGGLLGESPTLANLENDHGFISKKYISIDMKRPFGEA